VLLGLLLLLLLACLVWFGWLALQVRSDLADARGAAERLQSAVADGDRQARLEAAGDLTVSAGSAAERTDSASWSALTVAPVVGDDAEGVRALSRSLDVVATDAVEPLGRTLDHLDDVSGGGRIDVDTVARLQAPLTDAADAMGTAYDEVAGLESSGYAGSIRGPFDEYVAVVGDARRALLSSATATEVLPGMLGAEEPERFLMVFQNNAEIRGTGGLPGSWAVVEAEDGRLRLAKQGTGSDFGALEQPLPISKVERQVYGVNLGTYFLDANYTPDFPRAAELWNARWDMEYPDQPLDGVVTLDPVALSYLLEGTGPIRVAGTTLTADNLVEELLSRPYKELQPEAQDALFAGVARAIFGAVSGDLESPLDFVRGLDRAAQEGRFRVAAFDPAVAEALAGTRVEGSLSGDDGRTPHVDVALNDSTGSKMSYYLRYYGSVTSRGCRDGVQQLAGTVTLRQSIPPQEARELPDSVTGGGQWGTTPGEQLVRVRLYAPYGGSFGEATLNGRRIDRDMRVFEVDGRPVTSVLVWLSSRKQYVINWAMETGPGQTGAGELEMTPSVVAGANRWTFPSAC
jgi:hypothetical protein